MPIDPDLRETRQRQILAILAEERVTSQLELVDLLQARGIAATQSSVSRDLRDLGVAWIGGRYRVPEGSAREDAGPGLAEVARLLRAARPAGPHLTVVTTTAGAAQSVGAAIDAAGWPEVVGTLAGDDTIFAATSTAAGQQRLLARLRSFLKES